MQGSTFVFRLNICAKIRYIAKPKTVGGNPMTDVTPILYPRTTEPIVLDGSRRGESLFALFRATHFRANNGFVNDYYKKLLFVEWVLGE